MVTKNRASLVWSGGHELYLGKLQLKKKTDKIISNTSVTWGRQRIIYRIQSDKESASKTLKFLTSLIQRPANKNKTSLAKKSTNSNVKKKKKMCPTKGPVPEKSKKGQGVIFKEPQDGNWMEGTNVLLKWIAETKESVHSKRAAIKHPLEKEDIEKR